MFRVSLKFGLVCGALLCGVFVISLILDVNPFIEIGHLFIDTFILGVFFLFAVNYFKSNSDEGRLHFWQGMTVGFFVYSVGTAVFVCFLLCYFLIDPDLLVSYRSAALGFLEERSSAYKEEFGETQYGEQVKAIEQMTALRLTLSASAKKLIAGFFVTPVISIILRKQHKQIST